jgi:hypothetical protein
MADGRHEFEKNRNFNRPVNSAHLDLLAYILANLKFLTRKTVSQNVIEKLKSLEN